jgi:hypothetical protein
MILFDCDNMKQGSGQSRTNSEQQAKYYCAGLTHVSISWMDFPVIPQPEILRVQDICIYELLSNTRSAIAGHITYLCTLISSHKCLHVNDPEDVSFAERRVSILHKYIWTSSNDDIALWPVAQCYTGCEEIEEYMPNEKWQYTNSIHSRW